MMPINQAHRQAWIMLVDDEPVVVQRLELVLHTAGYEKVCGLTDASEAADEYRALEPDLVVLDLEMPGIDGFAVMEQLRAIDQEQYVPVVVMTGATTNGVRLRALESGAKGFLNKPIDDTEALALIQNVLEVRLLIRQVRAENRMLEEKVWERTKELKETQLEIIHRLGRAAEYRDTGVGAHTVRISLMCAELARAAGMVEEECELLMNASPMHDIGKIGIPDRILLKPDRLTHDEWEIMRKHAEISAELLAGGKSELMQMAELIARSHHERWDGKGYPNGITGDAIPLVGRIVAICDVFDALTSERPYKSAWTVEHAMHEIDRGSGSHFDPHLVDLFRGILPDIMAIMEAYREETEGG